MARRGRARRDGSGTARRSASAKPSKRWWRAGAGLLVAAVVVLAVGAWFVVSADEWLGRHGPDTVRDTTSSAKEVDATTGLQRAPTRAARRPRIVAHNMVSARAHGGWQELRAGRTLPELSDLPHLAQQNLHRLEPHDGSDLASLGGSRLLTLSTPNGPDLHEYADSFGTTATLELVESPFAETASPDDPREHFQRAFDLLVQLEPHCDDLVRPLIEDRRLLVFMLRDGIHAEKGMTLRGLTLTDRDGLPFGIALPLGFAPPDDLPRSALGNFDPAAQLHELSMLMRHEAEHVLALLSGLPGAQEPSAEREWMITYWDLLFLAALVKNPSSEPKDGVEWTDVGTTYCEKLRLHRSLGARAQLDRLGAKRPPTTDEQREYASGCNLYASIPAWARCR